MGWQDLLAPTGGEEIVLPWIGGRKVHSSDRTWKISGPLPPEHGWYSFKVDGGRTASLVEESTPEFGWEEHHKTRKGYLVGDRLIPDDARVDPDPAKLFHQTFPVHLVEFGLDRFSRAVVAENREGLYLYVSQEFPQGPEMEVLTAYQDRKASVAHVKDVTPSLDLAFRWESRQRELAEERERELARLAEEERKRQEAEERLRQAMKDAGTGAGRRALARQDFKAAARAALAISGAELLDSRPSRNRANMVVQYRFRHRRLECEVNKNTLRIVDAGVCLDDHRGTKGDAYFTLESLPAVIGEALDRGILHVWRHVPGDPGDEDYW